MSVAIMTDTNSGISPKDGEQYGIWVVPMPIIIDNKEYFGYENITNETLFNGMSIAKEVRSSQPSMHMFQALLGVSEYLYRLRELSLMYDGKS